MNWLMINRKAPNRYCNLPVDTHLELGKSLYIYSIYAIFHITLSNARWLYSNFRPVALQICQGLQDLGWIEPLSTKEPAFKDDFFLYIPGPVSRL